jgi:hypothetical protein
MSWILTQTRLALEQIGASYWLALVTGKICDVNPFLQSYQPVQEIPVARCCTVWMDQTDSMEYLLVGDHMLWFGTLLPNSLFNPNQMRAYGIRVHDDPAFRRHESHFGIDSDHAFIPFDTTGTVVALRITCANRVEEDALTSYTSYERGLEFISRSVA